MQSELFVDLQSEKQKSFHFPTFAGRFLHLKVAYEDIVFGLLGLMLVVLASFCLGVERGKQLDGGSSVAVSVSSPAFARPAVSGPAADLSEGIIVAADVQMRRPAPVIPAPAVMPSVPLAGQSGRSVYAIQLASYAGNQSAQSEVQRLQRKGVQALVVKQSKYFELRAVGFESRIDAEKALLTLKKIYRDAFIKQPSVS